MLKYSKPYLTLEQQLQLLKNRGMEISDDQTAINHLRKIGYYRLSAYWYPFRKHSLPKNALEIREDNFITGTKFENIIHLYVFDKRLRLLLLDALERIEIAVRFDISYELGKKDPFAHTKPELLHGNFTKKKKQGTNTTFYESWLIKHRQLIGQSREDFVRHYKQKYGEELPIWTAVEIWDFGLLSKFFHGMTVLDKTKIASKYGIDDHKVMESWLRCLNYIRNIVAHHSRLWNRNLIDQPKLPKKGKITTFDAFIENPIGVNRVYVAIKIISFFMDNIYPNSSWSSRLKTLLTQFPKISGVSLQDMGFPKSETM